MGPGVTEADLQRWAEDRAEALGLLWHHCADPRRCRGPRGFPDLVALGINGLMAAELKGPYGETSADQDRWIWTAYKAGLTIPVLKPADQAALELLLKRIK